MPDQPDNKARGAVLDEGIAERRRVLWLMRVVFLALLVIFLCILILADSGLQEGWSLVRWWPLAALGAALFFAGVLAVDILTPKRKLSTISAVFVGLIAGVIVAFILGLVMDLFAEIYGGGHMRLVGPVKIMIGLGVCYLTITTVLHTQNDFRLVIPYVEFAKQRRGARPLILDSSALIDARILDLAEVGILQSPLVIPRFVVEELQRLSDSSDRAKRARGRRGLDTVTRLQRSPKLDVKLDDTVMPAGPVDQLLVELARIMPGVIVTTDTGLSRIASIQGVQAINMHDAAAAVKQAVIPGDRITVRLIRKGEQRGQAVGYLDDGTMVVAEDGEAHVGTEATLTVTGSVQTNAGRLVFARVQPMDEAADSKDERPRSPEASSANLAPPETGLAPEPTSVAPLEPGVSEPPAKPAGAPIARRALRNPRRG